MKIIGLNGVPIVALTELEPKWMAGTNGTPLKRQISPSNQATKQLNCYTRAHVSRYIIKKKTDSLFIKWMGNKPEGFIHYKDSTFKPFWR